MNWITNYVRPKINSMLGRRTDMPENLWIKDPETGEMVFHKDLEQQPVRHPVLRPSHEDLGQGAAEILLRRRQVRAAREPQGRAGSAEIPRREALYRPAEGRQGQDRPGRRHRQRAGHDRRPAGRGDGAGFRLHGRLARHGRGRRHRARFRGRPAAQAAADPVRRLRRRAHAGRHPVADAVAAHHGRRRPAEGSRPALHRRA